jgi:2-haloalkanoic acid dehalogenase type II
MTNIQCIAFDCFGTVFDMEGIPREQIRSYVEHVRQNDFSPFVFPDEWWELKAHADAAPGIRNLQAEGYCCVALSNGSHGLLTRIAAANDIYWDHIVDLAAHRVYKPHLDAYRTVENDTSYEPANTLMVTANPTFGDVEGAAAVGMKSMIIRQGYPHTILDIAAAIEVMQ